MNDKLENKGPLVAAIDLGTNTCRLLIAQKTEATLVPVEIFTRIVRLGDELVTYKRISNVARGRAVDALSECAKRLEKYSVSALRCVATAACRDALNRDAFVQEIREKTGLPLEVISTQEEARLAMMSCADQLTQCTRYALIFDIGGGSTELAWVELIPGSVPQVIDSVSIPFGVVTVAEAIRGEPDEHEFQAKVRRAMAKETKAFADRCHVHPHLRKQAIQMIGTSGTLTTLAAIYKNLDHYDRAQVHGMVLNQKELQSLIYKVSRMTLHERLLHPCIGPQRADLIMGGVVIFQGIYDIFGINEVKVVDRGLREGIIFDLFLKTQGGVAA
ncbi:Ppx/GppA family phosphatase [Candidatus Bealeia paramacronuclearis]|uniref:Ppx/GppA family phosphatase n=1 Tax=Candidatus Bealeia paramacronuclearis TaxID=1921001 RepID=A0ABZ2C2F6_9PROT|nr:Ppx/GppA family phosphatase [Candidatus Bealeia paramacronuclearis]